MKLNLISKDKDSIKVELVDMDDTLIQPLIDELMRDETVVDARYHVGQPELEKPNLYVKVKEGKPQSALKRAAKALSGTYDEWRELFNKTAK